MFARKYIAQCEERYGQEEVELLLDSCHALMNNGVDRYKRPAPLSMAEEQKRQDEREAYLQFQINDLWRTLPTSAEEAHQNGGERWPEEPQENLLYFIEKNAPLLEPWQREVVRIVRKIGQYFYPQRQTQVMNEGWACFWHDRSLTLRHFRHNRRPLGETTEEMLRHIRRLRGFTARLESLDDQGRVQLVAEC